MFLLSGLVIKIWQGNCIHQVGTSRVYVKELLRGNSWGLQVEYLRNIEVTEMNCGASGKFLSVGALGVHEEGFGGNICLSLNLLL